MKKLLRDSKLSELDRNMIRLTISEEQKNFRTNSRIFTRKTMEDIKDFKTDIKYLKKEQGVKVAQIRKTLKEQLVYDNKQRKILKTIKRKMNQTLRKKGKLSYNNETIDNIINDYKSKIERDVAEDQIKQKEAVEAKAQEKALKEEEKQKKKDEKMEEKAELKVKALQKKEENRLIREKKKADEKVKRDEIKLVNATRKKQEMAEKIAAKVAAKTRKAR